MSDAQDEQDQAEDLDPSVLGEDADDAVGPDADELPGLNRFTDDGHRLNAEDPSIVLDADTEAPDTLAERDWRTQPEHAASGGLRLAESDDDEPGYGDDEKDLVTPFSEIVGDDEASAEEAAMHIEEG